MGTSITTWENAKAYFTFADSPSILALFSLIVLGIVGGLIWTIIKHENKAFESQK